MENITLESINSKKKDSAFAHDFVDIPYDLYPNYDSLVRRPLSINILRENLKRHKYSSMSAFSKDFYEMLSNGRQVCPKESQVWSDTPFLAQLFEKAKSDAATLDAATPVTVSGYKLVQRKLEDSEADGKSAAGCHVVRCGVCSARFRVSSWPAKAYYPAKTCKLSCPTIESIDSYHYMEACGDENVTDEHIKYTKKAGMAKNLPLQWVCRDCVAKPSTVGKVVKVWWHEDQCFYSGVVDVFESSSGRHKIKYFDGIWEFVDLRVEPVLIAYPMSDKMKSADAGEEEQETREKSVSRRRSAPAAEANDADAPQAHTPRARAPSSKLVSNAETGAYDQRAKRGTPS